MLNQKIGLGLVGAGAIGRVHAGNIHEKVPDARLAAVADIDRRRRRASLNSTVMPRSIRTMPKCCATIQSRPSYSASPFLKLEIQEGARQASTSSARKPMALSMQDADEMVSAVDASGIEVQVGYQRRFDPSYLKARWPWRREASANFS